MVLRRLVGLTLIMLGACTATPAGEGMFSATGPMETGRAAHTATLLPTGKVLVAGGHLGDQSLSSSEIFDPTTGDFAAMGTMGEPRESHSATLLPSGKILIVGGLNIYVGGTSELSSAELYDPSTGTFAPTGSMTESRSGHTASLLIDGTVLVVGGGLMKRTFVAELYDPVTETFGATGDTTKVRTIGHTATLLLNGTVLVAGGSPNQDGGADSPTAELYDPTSGLFTPTAQMAEARVHHTSTLLSDGRVLIAGGNKEPNSPNQAYEPSAELYDPSNGLFEATGVMSVDRYAHTATLLSNNKVLLAGGFAWPPGETISDAELYDPTNGTFRPTAHLSTARVDHTATLLMTGQVLIAGGLGNDANATALSSAELYR
jgi:hypothetical protein